MSIASKLQIKEHHRVAVLNKPDDVELDLAPSASADDAAAADAVIVFVTTAGDLGTPETASALGAGQRDALAWVAYPKGGQRGTDLTRDILAARLADRGVRAVRQVSIDDTWSALRFRPST
jgi:hypothetical protein